MHFFFVYFRFCSFFSFHISFFSLKNDCYPAGIFSQAKRYNIIIINCFGVCMQKRNRLLAFLLFYFFVEKQKHRKYFTKRSVSRIDGTSTHTKKRIGFTITTIPHSSIYTPETGKVFFLTCCTHGYFFSLLHLLDDSWKLLHSWNPFKKGHTKRNIIIMLNLVELGNFVALHTFCNVRDWKKSIFTVQFLLLYSSFLSLFRFSSIPVFIAIEMSFIVIDIEIVVFGQWIV